MSLILLVEDNEMNRDMLSRRLCRAGYDVVEAVDGEAGCRLASEARPQLVLMDMSLPLLDGWTATRRIKSDPATAHLPVIALTAHALNVDRRRALEAGCDEYASKPVDFKDLLEKMARLLSVHADADPGAGATAETAAESSLVRPCHE